jgi:hypothetical protein
MSTQFKAPVYIIFITLIWVLPFFLRDCNQVPIAKDFLPYFVVVSVALIIAAVLFVLNITVWRWEELNIWIKYLIILVSYSTGYVTCLSLMDQLNSKGYLRFFGGDAGGSFFLLYFPTVILYAVIGGVTCIIYSAFRIRSNLAQSRPNRRRLRNRRLRR